MRDPIIVVGSGRSGTSNCTMLLHTRLGVDMGDPRFIANSWRPKNWRTTKGNWERASTRIILYGVQHMPNKLSPLLLVELIEELKGAYGDRPWGFKHPDFTRFLPMLIEYFPDAYFIECWRPAKEVADSMSRIYTKLKEGQTKEQKRKEHFERVLKYQGICKEWLAGANRHMRLDLADYSRLGEDGVVAKLSNFVEAPMLEQALEIPGPFHKHGPCGGLYEKHYGLPGAEQEAA